MTEFWGTSSLSPIHKVTFNWKIESFHRVVKSFGRTGFDSPEFKVISSDGQIHSLKLKFKAHSGKFPGILMDYVRENGETLDLDEATLINVEVINTSSITFCMAGTMKIHRDNYEAFASTGAFGNPEEDKFMEFCWQFKNNTNNILVVYGSGDEEEFTGFSVDDITQTMYIKVQLTTPGVVTNSVSLVSNECSVKEIGAKRLVSDIKTLLSKAHENADFKIVCEGQNFPCHEAILRSRSQVFDKMFEPPSLPISYFPGWVRWLQWLCGGLAGQVDIKESSIRELTIPDVKKYTIEAMLEYMYSGEISKKLENESELIYVADKYHLTGLLEICFHKLPEAEDHTVIDILMLADRHGLKDFKRVAMQKIMMNKSEFVKDKEFVDKMSQAPQLLMELFQQ